MTAPDFVAYAVGLVYASACTTLPDELAASRMNVESPAPHGWAIADEPFANGDLNGRPCDQHPDTHRHLLFVC
jgi:hypothetical protein